MSSPLRSLVASGTKLWIDSVDPKAIIENKRAGATGATSNPIIIAEIIQRASYREQIKKMKCQGKSAHDIAWRIDDQLVTGAEKAFLPVFERTRGNDGYVSFELDPLIEDLRNSLSLQERIDTYKALGATWALNHPNRLIKVPATDAGIASLADIVAAGVNVNVTLIFTQRQYEKARNAVWHGAQQRLDLDRFKSVYSIFVSRIDTYTREHLNTLNPAAQGWVGIVNAKTIWRLNREYWSRIKTPLQQEIVFASTGTKSPDEPKWKYAQAFAGSDIETNPPETNLAIETSGLSFAPQIEELPPPAILEEIEKKIDWNELEKVLMKEGVEKFAAPQRNLIKLIESL